MSYTLDFIRSFGTKRLLACILCKQRYRQLQKRYGFNPWHISGAYPCREYKHRAVALASSLHPDVAVEIGCGLGEIISRVKAERRYGFDIDAQAITTAAHLSGHRANYSPASLFETEVIRKKIQEPNIDVLIMVNWPHALHMKELRDALAGLNTNIPIRKIIIDTIRPGAMKEAHIQHSRQDLEMLGTIRQTMDGGDGMRDIHILETHFIR